MKIFFYSLSIFSLLLFTQCSGKPDRPDSVLNETQKAYDGADLSTPGAIATPTPTAEPPQNADGVWHYTCSNGCAGGAGAAQACAVCGNMLAHNSAYHAGNNATPPGAAATPVATGAGNTITFDPNNPGATTSNISFPGASTPVTAGTAAPPSTPEPPQNAAGVWHYTCSNGCAGGGGSATACAGCGNTLAHNSAYHQ
jgi:hypothetical protein